MGNGGPLWWHRGFAKRDVGNGGSLWWPGGFAKQDVGNGSAPFAEVFDPITAATAEPEE